MKLTRFTDYSLRVLIYLGLQRNERVTIREISAAYGVSRNHLMKVVSTLTRLQYVAAQRGPGGGLALARPAADINLAAVINDMEEDMNLVECFCPQGKCVISPECQLRKVLQKALRAYIECLQAYTLQDLLQPATGLENLLGINHKAA
jgi:Rrf2 family nitric oxide-sensitive transcriptional repressor